MKQFAHRVLLGVPRGLMEKVVVDLGTMSQIDYKYPMW